MALHEKIAFRPINVTTCLYLILGTVPTDRARKIPKIIFFLLEVPQTRRQHGCIFCINE
jgi:hypothetical protein